MIAWARTADGWALNLDGSDASLVFSLPRLELVSSSRGWRSLCFLPDGSRREIPAGSADTLRAAQALAVEQARALVGAAYQGAFARDAGN
jgi:hypothetical protein